MILLADHKLCILTPPKTGSTSLHQLLCGGRHRGWGVVGPSMDGRVDKHTCALPAEATTYRLAAVVRHPLDRLVSLWHHLVRFDAREGRATQSFWFFANQVGRGEQRDPFFAWNQCRHLEGVPLAGERAATVLRLENLAAGLAELGLSIDPAELPHLDRAHRSPWPRYYDASLLAIVRDWARPDCERFGYPWPGSAPGSGSVPSGTPGGAASCNARSSASE